MSDAPPIGPEMRYEPSPKHCEPITAAKPGTKCPRWSAARAQQMLNDSEAMGEKRVVTWNGLAFVAQRTQGGDWHGYPEAWDKIDLDIRMKWLNAGLIRRKHLKQWKTRVEIQRAWQELDDAEQ
jgi:hypothetical protein